MLPSASKRATACCPAGARHHVLAPRDVRARSRARAAMAGGIIGSPAIRFDVCGGALVLLIGMPILFEIGLQVLNRRFEQDKTSRA